MMSTQEDSPVIGQRVARGAALAVGRLLLTTVVSVVAAIFLTRLISPSDYGVYAVVASLAPLTWIISGAFVLSFLSTDEKPAPHVVNAAFWIFEGLAVCLALFALVMAMFSRGQMQFLWFSMALFLPLAPLRFPAEYFIYRDIRTERLAFIEAAEVLTYQTTAVVGALLGLGVRSFGVGLVFSAITSAAVAYVFSRWRPSSPSLRPAYIWLRRALPFQMQIALTLARERATLPLLALIAGASATGYFSWAYSAAALPLTFAYLAGQSLYGAFSHLRNDVEASGNAASLAGRLTALSVLGASAILAGSLYPLITVVFSSEWLPATNTMRLLLVASCALSLAAVLAQMAQIDGRVHEVNRWQIVQIAVIWLFGLPLAFIFGATGLATAYAVAACLYLYLSYQANRMLYPLQGVKGVVVCAFASLAAATAGWGVADYLGASVPSLFASATTSLIVYLLIVTLLARTLLADIKTALILFRGAH